MWLRCETRQQIADATGIALSSVDAAIANFAKNHENGADADSVIFRNFEPKIYNVWNFQKATNEVRHFGNIPPEIIDNLLYYYTRPYDLIVDAFGCGDSER